MVSLTYHDEHVAWQQRVQKEVTQAHRFQSSQGENFNQSMSPIKRYNRSRSKKRAHSRVYSTIPAANLNLGAMNVYAEVRGKYARNANNTVANLPQAPGVVSRPSTSGSLMNYSKRSFQGEENKAKEKPDETIKSSRPLKDENIVVVKKRRVREKDLEKNKKSEEKVQNRLIIEEDKNREIAEDEGENKETNEDENDEENREEEEKSEDDEEKTQEEADRKTEMSFKTTSSQHRYIEELEKLLKEEKIRRIEAEDKLQRLSSRHGKKY